MTHLLSTLKAREKSSAFLAIGLLAQAVGPNIKKHLPKISEAVRMSLPVKDAATKSVCFRLFFFHFQCFQNLTISTIYTAVLVFSIHVISFCICAHFTALLSRFFLDSDICFVNLQKFCGYLIGLGKPFSVLFFDIFWLIQCHFNITNYSF